MCRLSPLLKRDIGVLRENSKRNSFFNGGRKRKGITAEMLRVYKSELDWMNYKVVRKDMTAHHIIKREHGGRLEWDNVALLMPVSHQYLHLIECKDINTYVKLNKIFKMINTQRDAPTKAQRELVEYLLCEFERMHQKDRNSEGKILIRREYKIRGSLE